ncbi:MAG: hypothetical protein IJ400_02240 [Clostridia bacterium]|nr:hypothetical protein [Clostridia bacterium]
MIIAENAFYLFGMGHREKYLYKCGSLIRIADNSVIHKWAVMKESFIYDEYTIILTLTNGQIVKLYENEIGFYINDVCLATGKLNLPSFEEYKYPKQLRILHHEVLISFLDNIPVPNFYVYNTAWYRDGAMMALVLEKTGNIHLLQDWALSITQLYDRNNKGNCEPDNLGQLAFVLSFFVDKSYPLIQDIIAEAKRIMKNGLLTGMTDYNHHEIYSTLWLRLALERLGISTDFIKIPEEFDSYARMFWMDKRDIETKTPFSNEYDYRYPYLWWAVKHFENEEIDDSFLEIRYPMSWESYASEAKYEKIAPLSKNYADNSFSAPHSWHASEMFMYLIEKRK